VTKGGEAKKHHWWPKGLQRYWADANDDVWWITPNGKTERDRRHRGDVGVTLHGHTLFRGDVWQNSFEEQFSIDTKVHNIVELLIELAPDGHSHGALKHFYIADKANRDLTLFILSLLIRSPSQRNIYELYPTIVNLPPNENVGKANMNQQYGIARRLCETGIVGNRHFTLLHSQEPAFIYGDGCLDWLSGNLMANRINGRALIALTPHLCVYLSTPTMMRSNRNCTAIRATTSMIEKADALTQIYSKEKLFYVGTPPILTANFRQNQFLQHEIFADSLFEELDELTGHPNSRLGFLTGW
jgi:hypothetical protein